MQPYLFDTHTHLHDDIFRLNADQAIRQAKAIGVKRLICVGTDAEQSQNAIKLAQSYDNMWASVGLHPHEAKKFKAEAERLVELLKQDKVVAIGECGLDYYYMHSPKPDQIEALRTQLTWAKQHNKPVILHVRSAKAGDSEAFSDLWKVWDEFPGLKGVVHSFSSTIKDMDSALERGLYIALNGIMTFSGSEEHRAIVKTVPLEQLLLESDAPFLTPTPFRGKINQPKYVESTAKYIAEARAVSLDEISTATSANAEKLFLK